jgi:hypothetical protein
MYRREFICHLAFLLSIPCIVSGHEGSSGNPALGRDMDGNGFSDFYERKFGIHGIVPHSRDSDGDGAKDHDEHTAGTDPFKPNDVLRVRSVEHTTGRLRAAWPSQRGKYYQLQISEDLKIWENVGEPKVAAAQELTDEFIANGTAAYLRVTVADIDTDGDGINDWEEYQLGYDPQRIDSDNDGVEDPVILNTRLEISSQLTVYTSQAIANEGGRAGEFRIHRNGDTQKQIVTITYGGTATYGLDYQAPTLVTFDVGQSQLSIPIVPLADNVAETAGESVTISVSPTPMYQVLGSGGAALFIQEPASGIGLTGKYYDNGADPYNSGEPYVSGANFNPADLKETRIDGPIFFDTETAGNLWIQQNFYPSLQFTDADNFSIEWTGQIEPPTTGTYTFTVYQNFGSKLTIAGRILSTDAWWTASNSIEVTSASINLTAGKREDIKLEYFDKLGNSGIKLYWSGPGFTKQVVPRERLYPTGYKSAPSLAPSFSINPTAVAFQGQPFSYQLAASELVTSFSSHNLPAGLTIASATGLISGTITNDPGLYFATVLAENAIGGAAATLVFHVLPSGSGLTREQWIDQPTTQLAAIPWESSPTIAEVRGPFQISENVVSAKAERWRGWVTAPQDGLYSFFLNSNSPAAELWVSADDSPLRTLKLAFSSQTRSVPVRLKAGKRYYIESRRQLTASPTLQLLEIGWLRPGQQGSSPSETIPTHLLSPYDAAESSAASGTLYLATMTPQGAAATKGSGLAIMVVNPSRTTATVSFTFGGLTGPVTNQHIHDSRQTPGPSGAILFDLDDAVPNAAGVYTWDFIPTGNHTMADVVSAIETGSSFLNLHTAAYPTGEIKGFFRPVSGSQTFNRPANTPALTIPTPNTAEVVRFLQQASFGAKPDQDGAAPWDPDSIESVLTLGYAGWIDSQLAMPPGNNPEAPISFTLPYDTAPTAAQNANVNYVPPTTRTFTTGDGRLGANIREQASNLYNGNGTPYDIDDFFRSWWKQAVSAPDQLRQRLAFALSQIFVVSGENSGLTDNAIAIAQYNDLLSYHAFGNFRTLLERVSLSPAMGKYLDMMRNKKPNPTSGRLPNENYAREIMQLFSLGLKRLHPDGSLALDSKGLPIPTYTDLDVVGLSHIFTGWTHNADNTSFNSGNATDYILPMKLVASQHASGEKNLFDNVVLGDTSTAATDATSNAEFQQALDLIFHHPNVAPFIARQLIQRLVTSNPSPGYIYRSALVFENDGAGTRGNLAALVKAILLDPEARATEPRLPAGSGKLREPILRTTSLLRALRGYSTADLQDKTDWLPLCRARTVADVDLTQPLPLDANGLTFVDGVRVWPGMKILVMSQTDKTQNGLYDLIANGQPLVRSLEADTAEEIGKRHVRVQLLSTGALVTYQQTASLTALGTSSLTFTAKTHAATENWAIRDNDLGLHAQSPLHAPTVFNFFEPDYIFPGVTGSQGLFGPEFQITSEQTTFDLSNYYYLLVGNESGTNGVGTNGDVRLEFNSRPTTALTYPWPLLNPTDRANALNNPEIALAHDVNALLNRLNDLLLAGRLSTALRTRVTTYLNTLPVTLGGSSEATQRRTRVRDAVYLIALSPEFAAQR